LSVRDFLEDAAAQGDESAIETLNSAPPLPEVVAHVWSDFLRLSAKRGAGGSGPNPITYEAMEAYQRWTGLEISPEGADMIDALDAAFLKQAYSRG